MANIIDYLDWYGDFDFQTVPFNEADNLILAQLCYLDLSEVIPPLPEEAGEGGSNEQMAEGDGLICASAPVGDVASRFWEHHPDGKPADMGPLVSPLTVQPLLRMATAGRRFRDMRLGCHQRVFDELAHEQFAVFTAQLPDGSYYLSYEGTDDTLVGWLEDCEMSYRITGAQVDALRYLERIAAMTTGPLRVGGHSKGGNLAAFAAALCHPDTQERIVEVWCNDSPGFVDEVVPLVLFKPLADRIRLFTPEYSVVGSLFEHVVEPVVIKSSGAGVMEHSALCWQVMRGSFERGEGLSEGSRRVSGVFDRLIGSHDLAGRKRLLDGLYDGLTAAGVTKIAQMFDNGAAGIAAMLGSVNGLEPAERQAMIDFLTGILASNLADTIEPVAKQLRGAIQENVAPAVEPVARQLRDAIHGAGGREDAGKGGGQAAAHSAPASSNGEKAKDPRPWDEAAAAVRENLRAVIENARAR